MHLKLELLFFTGVGLATVSLNPFSMEDGDKIGIRINITDRVCLAAYHEEVCLFKFVWISPANAYFEEYKNGIKGKNKDCKAKPTFNPTSADLYMENKGNDWRVYTAGNKFSCGITNEPASSVTVFDVAWCNNASYPNVEMMSNCKA